jgi:putative N6-adenine-specific DNA methylase
MVVQKFDKGNIVAMVAKTLFGLEPLLADELLALGASDIRILNRAVAFTGDKKLLYKANYSLRTALKVLIPVRERELNDAAELYDVVRSVIWSKYMGVEDTLAVEVALKSDLFTHSQFVAQRIKDAIVDQFREKFGRRPSVDLDSPTLRINAYLNRKYLTLSLDSSGDALYRRGYRVRQGPAPLNEVLAAGLVKLTGWNGQDAFVDMMCGSGTLVVEAAMLAAGIPPGALGRAYGFQRWKDYDRELFRDIEHQLASGKAPGKIIHASDIDPEAVQLAMRHARNARVFDQISFSTGDFNGITPPAAPGVLLVNPPYGERIQPEDINSLYGQLGDKMKKSFDGYTGWIFSGNPEALKHVGLRPFRRISLFNGQLECKLQGFNLYRGSKKDLVTQEGE